MTGKTDVVVVVAGLDGVLVGTTEGTIGKDSTGIKVGTLEDFGLVDVAKKFMFNRHSLMD